MFPWPYTNLHELNLDWILEVVKEFQSQYSTIDEKITAGKEEIESTAEATLEQVRAAIERMGAEEQAAVLAAINARAEEVISSIPADYTEMSAAVEYLSGAKIPFPVSPESKYGTSGQTLRTLGNGQTQWADAGLPTDEQTAAAVSAWLDDHPEATTTVQDGSLTPVKLKNSDFQPVNILALGAKNDGSEDCSSIINQYTATYDLYFPEGRYLISNPVTLKKSIIGAGKERGYEQTHGTWLIDGINAQTTGTFLITASKDGNETSISISNLNIALSGLTGGIKLISGAYLYYRISSINIIDVASDGILCTSDTTSGQSRGFYANDISMVGAYGYPASCGIRNTHFVDSRISNVEIMKCQIGIYHNKGILTCSDAHIYCGPRELTVEGHTSWWQDTIGIYCGIAVKCLFTNLYVDTARKQFECHGSDAIYVNGYIYWEDNTISDYTSNDAVICSIPNTIDQTRRMITIANGYILVTDHLNFLYDQNRINYLNTGFRYQNASRISTSAGYKPFSSNHGVLFDPTGHDYIEIAKLYFNNSGRAHFVISNNLGDYVDLDIRYVATQGFYANAVPAMPVRDKIELFLYAEDPTERILKVYVKKTANATRYNCETINTTGRILALDYLTSYNQNGTQMMALREDLNSADVQVSSTMPSSIGSMVVGTMYAIGSQRDVYRSLEELGLSNGCSIYDILTRMKPASRLQLQLTSSTISDWSSDAELYIFNPNDRNTLHKSLIIMDATTISQSENGETKIRIGQLKANTHTVTWKELTLS